MVIGLSDPSMNAIVEACRKGDPEAFRALYEAYKDKVYSIALYFFHGDPAAASDATQQVFLKLLRGIHQFRGDSGFSTWLYRMVVNTCMDSSRRAKARRVQPGSQGALPTSQGASRYFAARRTDAAPLQIGDQNEKMLFYRGVGNFQAPLRPHYLDNGTLEVRNAGARTIPLAILFENHDGKIGFRKLGPIKDVIQADPPEMNGDIEQLRTALIGDLIEFGLYRKEAAAMLDTWQDSWFEEGTRIIEIESREQVDEWLPARIAPRPEETTRVFVGRIEILSPGTRATILRAAEHADSATLNKFGRFLQPFAWQMSLNLAFPPIPPAGTCIR